MSPTTRSQPLSIASTIVWWEVRRLLYNAIMAVMGIISLGICAITIPLIYVLIALGLNALYTLSWIIELAIIRQLKSERAPRIYAPLFFWSFLVFSAISVLAFSISMLIRF
jgi:lipid-A-disaccharide synthase-like uncharacterized protein